MKFEYKNWFLENPQFPNHRKPNSTALWHTMDTESLFKQNLEKYPNSIHLQNYQQNPITYSYNNYGFRTSDNFSLLDSGNIFLGCSHTFGIGHYLENTWPYKLSQMIGGKNYNISEPGSGIFTQYRYLNYFKDKLNFKNVFHYLPNEDWVRYEQIKNNEFLGIFPWDNLSNDLIDFLYEDKTIHFINYIFIDAIRYMLNQIGCNYYLLTNVPIIDKQTPARDLSHYHVEEHSELADMFYYKYKNKITDNTDNSILLNELDPRKII
jgi:hypothetical protein